MIHSYRTAGNRINKFIARPHSERVTGCPGNAMLRYRQCLERGLRDEFPGPQGELLATAVNYLHRYAFDAQNQRRLRDVDSAAILFTFLTGTADSATMGLIRSAMVSSALLGDLEAVGQWAQAGLTRCPQMAAPWPATAPEWQWVLANQEPYVSLIRNLAQFLNPE